MDDRADLAGPLKVITKGMKAAPSFTEGIGATLLFAIMGTGARIAIPVLLQQIIDRGFVDGGVDMSFIYVSCGVAAVFIVCSSWSLRTAAARLGTRAEHGLYYLRVRLFSHIHRLSIENHHETRKGEMVSRVTSDIESMTQFFAWGGLTLLLDTTQIIVVTMVMMAYDWRLACVALVVSAPLAFVLRSLQGRLLRAHSRSRERNADFLAELGESFSGLSTLRAYGALEQRRDDLVAAARTRASANIRAGVVGAFLFPLGEIFAVFTVCAVVGVGLLIGPAGGLTAGALVGFVFLTYRLLEPIAEFTEVMDMTQSAVASLRRVLGVLEIPSGPPEPRDPKRIPAGSVSIQLDDVSFAYTTDDDRGDRPAVDRVSLHIAAGEHVALVGPSGSGKSTVGRLIARMIDPSRGAVLIGGVDARRVANEDLRTRVVIVPQEPFLFSATIEENLLFAAPQSTRDDMRRAFERLGLGEWLTSLPDSLDAEVGQRGTGLSAGERQLVALVRAAITSPDVLILDEATSSVDPVTEQRLGRALEALSAGRTTVSVAHRLSTASRADRVVLMDGGRIVATGSHTELLARSPEYVTLHEAWLASTSVDTK
jgi:putative ABC transport system ATP-binding protein